MSRPARSSAESVASLAAARDLPQAKRRSFYRRWSFFFIADLNGLADQRRLAVEEQDYARVSTIEGRIRRIIASLAWEPTVALRGAYAFAREKIDYPEDAWGPALIIGGIEIDRKRFTRWFASLKPEAQHELAGLPDMLERLLAEGP